MSYRHKRRGKNSTHEDESRTVYVGNMPDSMTWRQLKHFFSKFGTVVYAKCPLDSVTKKGLGFGFVSFEDKDVAYEARNAYDTELTYEGRVLRVRYAKKQTTWKREKAITAKPVEETNKKDEIEAQIDNYGESPFEFINDDCLTYILLFLGPVSRIRVERVCTSWRRCSLRAFKRQEHMAVRKEFRKFCDFMLLEVLKRCGTSLKSLNLSYISYGLENVAMQLVAKFCPGLEWLSMMGMSANYVGMEVLTSICKNLKSIQTVKCKELTEYGQHHQADEIRCAEFVCFNCAANCWWSAAVTSSPGNAFQSLDVLGKKLICLYWHLFQNCQYLEALDCSGNDKISGRCFKFATSHFQYLNAANCKGLSNEGFKELSQRCPDLKYLDISYCNNLHRPTVAAILKSCPKLTYVNLGGLNLSYPDEDTPNHVIRNLANPAMLTHLLLDNSGLQDEDLQFICSSCPNLIKLDISCNRLTDASVVKLASLHHLEELYICHLDDITSSALMGLVLLGKLKVLRAQWCKSLTDNLTKAIAKSCPNLQELDVAGVSSITDSTIQYLMDTLKCQPHRKVFLYVWCCGFYRYMRVKGCPQLYLIVNRRKLYL